MKRLALIVTGDRHAQWHPWHDVIFRALDASRDVAVVIHGDAPGIDQLADDLAGSWGWPTIPMPAQWDAHGKWAGPLRNEKMLDVLEALRDCGYECRVLAFHDDLAASKGTKDCVRRAGSCGFPVTVYGSDGSERAA